MEIVKVLSNIEINLFEDVKTQLLKDIQLSGMDLDGNIASPIGFYKSLLSLLEKENKTNPQILINLLYRVDVKEINIHNTLKELNISFEEAMAFNILSRTIEKVQFKKKFNI